MKKLVLTSTILLFGAIIAMATFSNIKNKKNQQKECTTTIEVKGKCASGKPIVLGTLKVTYNCDNGLVSRHNFTYSQNKCGDTSN